MQLTQLFLSILYFPLAMISTDSITLENKTIPESIKQEALTALSHYPELYDAKIIFKFKDHIKKSTMQAQPTWASFLKPKKDRGYIILISRSIQIETKEYTIEDIPSDVLVGWLGHELGHVMDYQDRSAAGMLIFGFKYLFSSKHIKEVERTADTYAIQHGMGDYILNTKNFILDNASISEKYKERLRSFYLSPEEVMELINDHTTSITEALTEAES